MITVHHLEDSRSQRILWMLEELGVDYEVKRYERDAETQLAPPELEKIHPLGKSPVIEDGDQVIAETGAIIEYLASKYGQSSMRPAPDSAEYQQYIYWLHYAEGSLMPPLLLRLIFQRIKETKMPFFAKPIARSISSKVLSSFVTPNITRHMRFIDDHLGKSEWFSGDQLSGADIQMSFPLEASMARNVISGDHPNIAKFVKRVQARPAYKTALVKGGPYSYT